MGRGGQMGNCSNVHRYNLGTNLRAGIGERLGDMCGSQPLVGFSMNGGMINKEKIFRKYNKTFWF